MQPDRIFDLALTPDHQREERERLRARQLDVLRSTYPGWEITYRRDAAGGEWWDAELRRVITERMLNIGVVKTVHHRDAIALAATLSCQAALVHACRTQIWNT
ncbi:hypothetical protein [Nonomuraea sp. NPDC002799]